MPIGESIIQVPRGAKVMTEELIEVYKGYRIVWGVQLQPSPDPPISSDDQAPYGTRADDGGQNNQGS